MITLPWIKYGLICCVIVSLLYGGYRFIKHQQAIGYQRAVTEATQKRIIATQEAQAKERVLNKQLQDARNEAVKREKQINDLSKSNAADINRMRNTIADLRNRLSEATREALRKQADAALDVSGKCSEEYSRMAEEAARLANELKMLQDAWPD